MDTRTYIQSFDWRTIIGIKAKFPEIRTVALLDDTTIVPDDEGAYPWLGGVDLEEFDRDFVKAAKSIGAVVLSPVHGVPSSSSVNTPGYKPFVTKELVKRAHREGLKVIPWTVSSPVREGGKDERTLTEGVAG
jgi:glycerophosphoryl diester phosphodiesterase